MSRRIKSTKVIVITAAAAAVIVAGVVFYAARHDLRRSFERAALPEAKEYTEVTAQNALPVSAPAPSPAIASAAPAVNLAVPFTPQAPHANWDLPYKEFCEEASALMAAKYLQGESISSPASADADMLAVQAFEAKRFGYYEDTTAAETTVILREHFNIDAVTLIDNPSTAQIKSAIAKGKLVIVPAAGRLLGNPYYTAPGPLYHMLVVKGYTADGQFITNDPGTRRGADFLYAEEVLMNAMHDWRDDKQIELGKKVVIVVG